MKFNLLLRTAFLVCVIAMANAARAETTIRVATHSDLKILDPIWTSAYITRDFGYMIYDTLFAVDADGNIKPQMVNKYEVSEDKLTHTMTLRDGLLWHDGTPVTAEDCAASIKRWAARDAMGQLLMSFVKDIAVVDAKTLRIALKEPTNLVTAALGKPSSNVPFMMPKRVAETSPNEQIADFTGSGPYIFAKAEWQPGNKVVFKKFDRYVPRPEEPSGLAGGKHVNIDRMEWVNIADEQTAVNALLNGEIDAVEYPSHDLLPVLKRDPNIKLIDWNPLGSQFAFRFNTLAKPFDNPKVREALWYAFNQKDFLDAQIGDPEYYKECKAMFVCGTPLESNKGMDGLLTSNFDKAKQLLKESGYDGTPIVLLQSTDQQILINLPPVAKSLMEKAGFKVQLEAMDGQSMIGRRNKKDPPWHGTVTSWVSADVMDPVVSAFVNSRCDKAPFGWPCDSEIEKLRTQFARETDPDKRKTTAEAIQEREIVYPTYIPLGQWYQPIAVRKNIEGVLHTTVSAFWNIRKTGN
jgi:peptide/nickel transport system substrate-binding protein